MPRLLKYHTQPPNRLTNNISITSNKLIINSAQLHSSIHKKQYITMQQPNFQHTYTHDEHACNHVGAINPIQASLTRLNIADMRSVSSALRFKQGTCRRPEVWNTTLAPPKRTSPCQWSRLKYGGFLKYPHKRLRQPKLPWMWSWSFRAFFHPPTPLPTTRSGKSSVLRERRLVH